MLVFNIIKLGHSYSDVNGDTTNNAVYVLIDTKGKSQRSNPPVTNGDKAANPSTMAKKSITLLWGATGEQEWTPALTTGLL